MAQCEFLIRFVSSLVFIYLISSHQETKRILLHSDLFREWIFLEMANHPTRYYFDNLSEDLQSSIKSIGECRSYCQTQLDCVQFAFRGNVCYTDKNPRLGNKQSQAVSGWIMPRIQSMMDKSGVCQEPQFGV